MTHVPIAIVGTGYVSDMYVQTLGNHPHLDLVGIHDRDLDRLRLHSDRWGVPAFETLEDLLDDSAAEIILNLTNPRDHFDVTRQCLLAGRHVYSEKPLGMTYGEAAKLVDLAYEKNLLLGSAPCSWMSEAAQTVQRALRDGLIGHVRLVYANFDDGLIAPKMDPWTWHNGAGIPWPAKDEFEVGCTYEHAGYVLTWLTLFFGAAHTITSFSSCQIPDKGIAVDTMAPDFSVGCLTYNDGVVARVTCGLVAPRDKSMTIVGDDGIITIPTVRSDVGPAYVQMIPAAGRVGRVERRIDVIRTFLERHLSYVPWSGQPWTFRRKLPLVASRPKLLVGHSKPVDFMRGPAEMASSLIEQRPCELTADLGLHITEIVQKLQSSPSHPTPIESRLRIADAKRERAAS